MSKQLNAWISDDIFAQVEALAKAEDRSISSWVRRLIMRELENDNNGPELVAVDGDAA
jgi:predicted HicB family RNase H-like nuclease